MTFLLIILNILLAVAGQMFTKIGVQKIGTFTDMPVKTFVFKAFLSPLVLLGLFLYLVSAVIWFMVLSKVNLSVAYPTLSLGYVLILAVSYFYFKEPITLVGILGVLFICLGVYLIFHHY